MKKVIIQAIKMFFAPLTPSFWYAPEATAEPEPTPTYINRIIIRFRDKRILTFEIPVKSKGVIIKPHKKFYLWWFLRNTHSFSFQHNKGVDVIIREEVIAINIITVERYE